MDSKTKSGTSQGMTPNIAQRRPNAPKHSQGVPYVYPLKK